MNIVFKNINDLKGYENNSRIHSNLQIIEIANSIKHFGFNVPIEIDENNTIISGHARLQAAIKLGLTEIPTIIHGHLDNQKKKAYIIAANKIALNAGWDDATLRDELIALKDANFDLNLTGFNEDELFGLLNFDVEIQGNCDPDECGDIEEETISKLNDIWLLGDHRFIIC